MLAETCFGLAKYAGGQARVLELLRRGAARPDFDLHGEIALKYAMGKLELERVAPEELPRPELKGKSASFEQLQETTATWLRSRSAA